MINFKISPGTAGNSDIPERYDDLPSHNIEVFQSENIQNILDAKSTNSEFVEIHYEIVKLDKHQKQNLESLLGEDFFKMLRKSFDKCEAQDIEDQVERVKLALENPDKWYSLIVTEKNTTGLIGAETGKEKGSKYHALMRHTNKSEKDGVAGGTFGKGSSVYTYTSGLWLWFAYSVLETPWEDSRVRFIGRGMIAPFIDWEAGQSYVGPLWYARPETNKDKVNGIEQQGLPYLNARAHQEAAKFGMPKRNDDDFGTSYLIPIFWPEGINIKELNANTLARKLKQEIIKRWFVPIYNGHLKCFIKVREEETAEMKIVKEELMEIPELKYKLEIIDWYNSGANTSDKRFKKGEIEVKVPILKKAQQKEAAKRYGKKIGHKQSKVKMDFVVRVLSDEEKLFSGFADPDEVGTVNRVALIRNKGMVVNHFPYDSKKSALKDIIGENNFEAILFGGKTCLTNRSTEEIDHLEMFLSYAENPAHNEWIHNSPDVHRCHLKRFEDTPTPYPVSRVNAIFTRIYSLISEFFPKDDKPPTKKEICSFWRNLYKLPSSGDRQGGETLFSYETLEEGFDKEGRYSWRFNFIALKAEKRVKLNFHHYLNSHEGPIKKDEEFAELGISEFRELHIIEDGMTVKEVSLEYDHTRDMGIPKEIIIKTCKITGNHLFKNMSPILEITDQS